MQHELLTRNTDPTSTAGNALTRRSLAVLTAASLALTAACSANTEAAPTRTPSVVTTTEEPAPVPTPLRRRALRLSPAKRHGHR